QRAIPFPDSAGLRFGPGRYHRTPLQRKTIAVFNHVLAVIENAIEPFVEMRNVIPSVEVVVDEDLPVAVQVITTTFEPMELSKIRRADLVDERISQGFFE